MAQLCIACLAPLPFITLLFWYKTLMLGLTCLLILKLLPVSLITKLTKLTSRYTFALGLFFSFSMYNLFLRTQ